MSAQQCMRLKITRAKIHHQYNIETRGHSLPIILNMVHSTELHTTFCPLGNQVGIETYTIQ